MNSFLDKWNKIITRNLYLARVWTMDLPNMLMLLVVHFVYFFKYRMFSNLIHTSFCRFLKQKKMLVRGYNLHLSFNRPLPTRQTDWIILDVTNALTVTRLTRRAWSSDWVTDNDSVMSDDGESDE